MSSSQAPEENSNYPSPSPRPRFDDDDEDGYLAFTQTGIKKYRDMQKDSALKFFIWLTAGSLAGFVGYGYAGTFLSGRVKNKYKLRNYKAGIFLTLFLGVTYHGYKLARRDFRRGRKAILDNPEYCFKVKRGSDLVDENGRPTNKAHVSK